MIILKNLLMNFHASACALCFVSFLVVFFLCTPSGVRVERNKEVGNFLRGQSPLSHGSAWVVPLLLLVASSKLCANTWSRTGMAPISFSIQNVSSTVSISS
jgi:hypothetical protein